MSRGLFRNVLERRQDVRRSLMIVAALLLVLSSSSTARLGENMEEITARYGHRVILPGSPPVCFFQAGPYQIYVILEDDVAACVIYTKQRWVYFSGQEIQLLMERNCPGFWRLQPRDDERRTWMSTNGDFAVYTDSLPVLARRNRPSSDDGQALMLVSGRALAKARRDNALWVKEKRSPLISALLQAGEIPREFVAPSTQDEVTPRETLDRLGL